MFRRAVPAHRPFLPPAVRSSRQLLRPPKAHMNWPSAPPQNETTTLLPPPHLFIALHRSMKFVKTVFLVPSRATWGGLSTVRRGPPDSSGFFSRRMPYTRSAVRVRCGTGAVR